MNTAARIQDAAEPSQVVVSGDVWRQIRQRSGYDDREMADVFAIQDEIARAIVTELEPELVTSGRYDLAVIHTGLGDPECAFALLERAYAKRSARMVYLKVDPPSRHSPF